MEAWGEEREEEKVGRAPSASAKGVAQTCAHITTLLHEEKCEERESGEDGK